MSNTFTQIHIQAVFAVQNRDSLISNKWDQQLYQYIGGIIKNQGHKPISINGTSDHVHILLGRRPTQSLSDLIREIRHLSAILR